MKDRSTQSQMKPVGRDVLFVTAASHTMRISWRTALTVWLDCTPKQAAVLEKEPIKGDYRGMHSSLKTRHNRNRKMHGFEKVIVVLNSRNSSSANALIVLYSVQSMQSTSPSQCQRQAQTSLY